MGVPPECSVSSANTIPEVLLGNILDCALHSTVTNARTYLCDASTLYHVVQRKKNPEYLAISPPNSNIIIASISAHRVTKESRKYTQNKTVSEIALLYISDVIGLTVHPKMDCTRILEYACKKTMPTKPTAIIQDRMKKFLSLNVYNEMDKALSNYVQDKLKTLEAKY